MGRHIESVPMFDDVGPVAKIIEGAKPDDRLTIRQRVPGSPLVVVRVQSGSVAVEIVVPAVALIVAVTS